MKIIRIFNNNIILVVDKDGSEKIVWAKGIGFGHHHGDIIESLVPGTVFTKEADSEWARSFLAISDEIPLSFFETTREIVSSAERNLNVRFNPNILITLSDYIYFAVKPAKAEQHFNGPTLADIKQSYAAEYEQAEKSIRAIDKEYHTCLSPSEAGFIAIHFVENEIYVSKTKATDNAINESSIIHELFSLITDETDLDLISPSVRTDRLATHLRFLLRRIKSKKDFQDAANDQLLYFNLCNSFPDLLKYLKVTTEFFEKHFD